MEESILPRLLYEAHPFGSGNAFGLFRTGREEPFLVVYDGESAKDLATCLNWAAADRERHESLAASK